MGIKEKFNNNYKKENEKVEEEFQKNKKKM